MEKILMIGDDNFDINVLKTKTYTDNIKCYPVSEREVQLRKNDEVMKFEAVNNIINQYDESERKKIPYSSPKILMVTYTSKDFAMNVLRNTDFPEGIYVDDLEHIRKLEEII